MHFHQKNKPKNPLKKEKRYNYFSFSALYTRFSKPQSTNCSYARTHMHENAAHYLVNSSSLSDTTR